MANPQPKWVINEWVERWETEQVFNGMSVLEQVAQWATCPLAHMWSLMLNILQLLTFETNSILFPASHFPNAVAHSQNVFLPIWFLTPPVHMKEPGQ